MRLDIPQDIPRHRELAPGPPRPAEASVPKEQESHPILRRLKALSERADQYKLNHEPTRRTRSTPPHKEHEAPACHQINDPREVPDTRRTSRNRIPPQTIGVQLRPEERKTMLELGRFRVVRTADLAGTVYDGKHRKLEKDLDYLRSKGLVTTRHINLRRDGKRRHIERTEVATADAALVAPASATAQTQLQTKPGTGFSPDLYRVRSGVGTGSDRNEYPTSSVLVPDQDLNRYRR